MGTSGFTGPDRRKHRVYVTHNTEYHTRGDICIAVRDRKSGIWVQNHVALGHKIEGSLHFDEGGGFIPTEHPGLGDALLFRHDRRDVITSRVEQIERPPRDLVQQYSDLRR